MRAHLAHANNRSCQRLARFRICTGGINSRITSPAPGQKKSKCGVKIFAIYEGIYMETISPYIVDFRSADELPYDHRSVANVDTIYAPNILGRACFFSLWRLVRPSQDGERGERLTNTLFGAKNRADCTNRECWFGAKCYIMSQAPSTQEPRKLDGKRKALTPQTQACT